MAQKREIPCEGQIYKHFKGSLYRIVTIAVHTETSDKLVVYQSVEKPERVFARPLDMFMSDIDRIRYPLIKAKYRFTLVTEEAESESEKITDCEVADNTEAIEKPEDTIDNKTDIEQEEMDTDDVAKYKVDGELVLDPIVEAILDEKEFSKKIEYFELLRGKCTEEMLTTLAISLDVQLSGSTVEEKYAEILKTLKMHDKYESARLRQ